MKPAPTVLAVDVGSQSIRAALFTADGEMVEIATQPAPKAHAPTPGYAEADPDAFFDAITLACADIAQRSRAAWAQVQGMSLSAQRASTVFLGRERRPTRPAILWSDQRRTESSPKAGGLTGIAFALSGASKVLERTVARAPVVWVAQHQPKIWRDTHTVLYLGSYLSFRLTGTLVDSTASQVGYLPFDFRRQTWSTEGNWRWRVLGPLQRAQMIELVPPCTPVGSLQAAAAAMTGRSHGSDKARAAAADKACEVLGSGCVDGINACLSYGTAATVNISHERYATVRRFLPAYPAAQPNRYLSEVQIDRGFWLVSWFLREFGLPERQQAARDGVPVESLLDALLEDSPAGASGLVAQPFFAPGVRAPGPDARGALVGFHDGHRRAHVYRALIEGLIFELRRALEHLERRRGQTVRDVFIAGGGGSSDNIMQISADILGRPTLRPSVGQCTSLGAAMCTAVGLGWYTDLAQAAKHMTRVAQRFEPAPTQVALYESLFTRVYRPLYGRLRPLYRQLAQRSTRG